MHLCTYICVYVCTSVCTCVCNYLLLLFLGNTEIYIIQIFFRDLFKGLYLPCYDLFSYHSQSKQNFPCVGFIGRVVVSIYDLVRILPVVYTSVINVGES
jgi:hypothetical protein